MDNDAETPVRVELATDGTVADVVVRRAPQRGEDIGALALQAHTDAQLRRFGALAGASAYEPARDHRDLREAARPESESWRRRQLAAVSAQQVVRTPDRIVSVTLRGGHPSRIEVQALAVEGSSPARLALLLRGAFALADRERQRAESESARSFPATTAYRAALLADARPRLQEAP